MNLQLRSCYRHRKPIEHTNQLLNQAVHSDDTQTLIE
jgi:hypothetical protein